jgi:DNA-binding NarL/FixJ family response regulator
VRVLIVEDDTLLREGLAALLQSEGIDVAATSSDATDLGRLIDDHDADLAIIDVRMPPTWTDEGLRAAIEIRRHRPGFPTLVLSAHVETRYASELLAASAGAIGYLLKERVGTVDEFLRALHRIAAGETVLDSEVVGTLMRRKHSPLAALTPREREVLELIAQGHRNGEVAAQLHVSETAINKHVRNIFHKLGLFAEDSGHRRVLAVLSYLRGT